MKGDQNANAGRGGSQSPRIHHTRSWFKEHMPAAEPQNEQPDTELDSSGDKARSVLHRGTQTEDNPAEFLQSILDVGLQGAVRMSLNGPFLVGRGVEMLADREDCDTAIFARCKQVRTQFIPETSDNENTAELIVRIEWKVHRTILRFNPCLKNLFFPENHPERTSVILKYHPMVFDSVVAYLYTGRFAFDLDEFQKGKHTLKLATKIPDGVNYQWPVPYWAWLTEMYHLGGVLGEGGMMDLAIAELSALWMPHKITPAEMMLVLEHCYYQEYCKDKQRKLKGFAVAVAVVNVQVHWCPEEVTEFLGGCHGKVEFLRELEAAKTTASKTLIQFGKTGVQAGEKGGFV